MNAKEEVRLILLVKNCKALYDPSESDYNNKFIKNENWLKIAEELNVPVKRVRARWQNLRDVYRRIRRKDLDGKNRGKWRYDKEMEFLAPFLWEKKHNILHFSSMEDKDQTPNTSHTLKKSPKILKSIKRSNSEDGEEYIVKKQRHFDDHIMQFFIAMASTVKELPPHVQLEAKTKVFEIITSLEADALQESQVYQETQNSSVLGNYYISAGKMIMEDQ